MNSNSNDCLAITACGEDRVGLVEKLTNRITETGCNIEQSRMGVLGGQFALIMRVSGSQAALSRLESQLVPLGQELAIIRGRGIVADAACHAIRSGGGGTRPSRRA
jgi:glycine cleavage system transcriptional repressor